MKKSEGNDYIQVLNEIIDSDESIENEKKDSYKSIVEEIIKREKILEFVEDRTLILRYIKEVIEGE